MAKLEASAKATVAQQQRIAPKLLYASAHVLALDALAYEEYLEQAVVDNIFLERSESASSRGASSGFIEESLAYQPSLSEKLLEQWHLEEDRPFFRDIGALIISNLSPQGYHQEPLQSLANAVFTIDLLEQVARRIAQLEPVGCATTGWLESIWVQSLQRPLHDGWAGLGYETFCEAMRCWQEGATAQTLALLQAQSEEELRSYLARFTLHPGMAYGSDATSYVQADLELHLHDDGSYEVVLQEQGNVARLSDATYAAMLEQVAQNSDALRWMRQQWYLANEVLAMHHYRKMQMLRVADYLVAAQLGYLRRDRPSLAPLGLATLAKELAMSVAAVSRTIKEKTIRTPTGSVPLKALLSRKQEHGDKSYSQQEIKQLVMHTIYRYGDAQLSDAKVARLLELQGISLARRTINKYRNEKSKKVSQPPKNEYL